MVPKAVYDAVAPVFRMYDVPDYIWQSIAHMETGGTFDPRALGDHGASYGLFQLYTRGGQGDPYAENPEVLFDPAFNAQVAAPEIARAYHQGKAMGLQDGPDLAAWVAANSGHPGYGLSMDYPAVAVVRKVAQQYYKASNEAGTGGGGETTDTYMPRHSDAWGYMAYGYAPDGRPLTLEEWRNQWLDSFRRGDILGGIQGYFFGFNSDGTPRRWGQTGDSVLPPERQYNFDKSLGEWALELGKEKAAEAGPDSPLSPQFWQAAAIYIVIGFLAVLLVASGIRTVMSPAPAPAE